MHFIGDVYRLCGLRGETNSGESAAETEAENPAVMDEVKTAGGEEIVLPVGNANYTGVRPEHLSNKDTIYSKKQMKELGKCGNVVQSSDDSSRRKPSVADRQWGVWRLS